MSPIASDLSFECLQKRLGTGELRTPDLNDRNRRLYGVPSQFVVQKAFSADREIGVSDQAAWDALRRAQREQR